MRITFGQNVFDSKKQICDSDEQSEAQFSTPQVLTPILKCMNLLIVVLSNIQIQIQIECVVLSVVWAARDNNKTEAK